MMTAVMERQATPVAAVPVATGPAVPMVQGACS